MLEIDFLLLRDKGDYKMDVGFWVWFGIRG